MQERLDALLKGQEAPEPRHGHSTTLLEVDGKGYLIVVGGGTGNILENFGVQDFYDAAVLEIATWNWLGKFRLDLEPGAAGPGRHHTACSGLLGQIFLFGGGQRPGGQVLLLDGEGLVRQALAGTSRRVALREVSSQISGSEREGGPAPALPTGRKMHGAACLLPWAPMLVVYGGWERGPHFDDLWVYAMGGDAEDLEGFECLLRSQGGQLPAQNEDPDNDFDEDDSPEEEAVPVRLVSPDGQVRVMRVPRRVLAQLLSSGVLQPREDGALQLPVDDPEEEGENEDQEEEEEDPDDEIDRESESTS